MPTSPSEPRDELPEPDGDATRDELREFIGDPTHPGPIPEVLREPANSGRPSGSNPPDEGVWGMAKAWGIALDFIFTIIAGAALGWGFDKWRGTAPNGLMVGIGVGFVVAFIRIVRATLRQEREDALRRQNRPRE